MVRATSNEEGVAIAWATSEYLLKKQAMTLYVSHYPKLTRLADPYPDAVQLGSDSGGRDRRVTFVTRISYKRGFGGLSVMPNSLLRIVKFKDKYKVAKHRSRGLCIKRPHGKVIHCQHTRHILLGKLRQDLSELGRRFQRGPFGLS